MPITSFFSSFSSSLSLPLRSGHVPRPFAAEGETVIPIGSVTTASLRSDSADASTFHLLPADLQVDFQPRRRFRRPASAAAPIVLVRSRALAAGHRGRFRSRFQKVFRFLPDRRAPSRSTGSGARRWQCQQRHASSFYRHRTAAGSVTHSPRSGSWLAAVGSPHNVTCGTMKRALLQDVRRPRRQPVVAAGARVSHRCGLRFPPHLETELGRHTRRRNHVEDRVSP